MRRAAGIVVDRGAVWLVIEADGRLAAMYSDQIGSDDEDGHADRFSSLHAALGMPDSVGRLVGKIRLDSHPDGEVEIYVVQADDFDADGAVLAMIKIAPEQIEGSGDASRGGCRGRRRAAVRLAAARARRRLSADDLGRGRP